MSHLPVPANRESSPQNDVMTPERHCLPTGILWAHSRADLRVVGQQVCSFSFFRGNAAAAADFSTESVLVPGARYIAVAAGVPDLGNKRPVIPPQKAVAKGHSIQHT